ncbi:MAG: MgtC/SapB family protein [Flavobacteriales bacterium]
MELRIVLDLGIATVLAGVVGLERELGSKPAGLRTHMIIGAVAALFVHMGQVAVQEFLRELPPSININTDPLRIFEAIVVGVSFIGAGTIIRTRDGRGVQYLTTAASLLLSAGIGMAVGCQLYLVAVGVALLALVITRFMARVEAHLLGTRELRGDEDEE